MNKYLNLNETGLLLNDTGKASASRKLDRITEMEFYSHGLPGEISLDLDGKSSATAKVDFKTIKVWIRTLSMEHFLLYHPMHVELGLVLLKPQVLLWEVVSLKKG